MFLCFFLSLFRPSAAQICWPEDWTRDQVPFCPSMCRRAGASRWRCAWFCLVDASREKRLQTPRRQHSKGNKVQGSRFIHTWFHDVNVSAPFVTSQLDNWYNCAVAHSCIASKAEKVKAGNSHNQHFFLYIGALKSGCVLKKKKKNQSQHFIKFGPPDVRSAQSDKNAAAPVALLARD